MVPVLPISEVAMQIRSTVLLWPSLERAKGGPRLKGWGKEGTLCFWVLPSLLLRPRNAERRPPFELPTWKFLCWARARFPHLWRISSVQMYPGSPRWNVPGITYSEMVWVIFFWMYKEVVYVATPHKDCMSVVERVHGDQIDTPGATSFLRVLAQSQGTVTVAGQSLFNQLWWWLLPHST